MPRSLEAAASRCQSARSNMAGRDENDGRRDRRRHLRPVRGARPPQARTALPAPRGERPLRRGDPDRDGGRLPARSRPRLDAGAEAARHRAVSRARPRRAPRPDQPREAEGLRPPPGQPQRFPGRNPHPGKRRSSGSSPGRKLRMGLDLVLPGRGGHDDESIASFLRRRFGQEAVDRLGEPLLAGIHAGDPERLSILATFPRLRELERTHGSLVRATRRGPKHRAGEAPPAAFYSLRCGLAELVAALVERLEPASLRTRAAVVAVERRDHGFELRLEGGERRSRWRRGRPRPAHRARARARYLTPPGPCARSLRPRPPRCCSDSRTWTRHPLDGYGLVVPASEGPDQCLELRLDEASVPAPRATCCARVHGACATPARFARTMR